MTKVAQKRDAINPEHYKSHLLIVDKNGDIRDSIQWAEKNQYKKFWRENMRAYVQALLDLCADKYLSRLGQKDDEVQEMEKAIWYLKFATAIAKNGYKPVRVSEVDVILAGL